MIGGGGYREIESCSRIQREVVMQIGIQDIGTYMGYARVVKLPRVVGRYIGEDTGDAWVGE